jgi:hypothetical protein
MLAGCKSLSEKSVTICLTLLACHLSPAIKALA